MLNALAADELLVVLVTLAWGGLLLVVVLPRSGDWDGEAD